MKRHAALVPLSRDHHRGLVMARRLTTGQPANPRDDWPADRGRQAARLVRFFETDLRPHFAAEEAHVFPAAARALPDGDRRTRALVAEHETMRAMIRELADAPASRLDALLTAFGELLRAHIRAEEHELFQQMQAACDPETLETLGTRIAGRGATCDSRPAAGTG